MAPIQTNRWEGPFVGPLSLGRCTTTRERSSLLYGPGVICGGNVVEKHLPEDDLHRREGHPFTRRLCVHVARWWTEMLSQKLIGSNLSFYFFSLKIYRNWLNVEVVPIREDLVKTINTWVSNVFIIYYISVFFFWILFLSQQFYNVKQYSLFLSPSSLISTYDFLHPFLPKLWKQTHQTILKVSQPPHTHTHTHTPYSFYLTFCLYFSLSNSHGERLPCLIGWQ